MTLVIVVAPVYASAREIAAASGMGEGQWVWASSLAVALRWIERAVKRGLPAPTLHFHLPESGA